jgi:hypothetical protein
VPLHLEDSVKGEFHFEVEVEPAFSYSPPESNNHNQHRRHPVLHSKAQDAIGMFFGAAKHTRTLQNRRGSLTSPTVMSNKESGMGIMHCSSLLTIVTRSIFSGLRHPRVPSSVIPSVSSGRTTPGLRHRAITSGSTPNKLRFVPCAHRPRPYQWRTRVDCKYSLNVRICGQGRHLD